MINKYNDNELLYFISEHNETAFEILCEKYRPMIINRIQRFRIQSNNFEDFYQECIMTLYKCVITYREDKNLSFNKYLDMCIQNKIKSLLRRDKNYFYNVQLVDYDEIDYLCFGFEGKMDLEDTPQKINCLMKRLSLFERRVLNYINNGCPIDEIAKKEKRNTRSIYNAITRLKIKETKEENDYSTYDVVFSGVEEIVFQYYKQGMTPKEISRYCECEVSKIYNTLKRIKNKIKKNKDICTESKKNEVKKTIDKKVKK